MWLRGCRGFYQVVDDVEAVVLAVVGVDAAVSLLPHVILQRGFISECFLTVQTLQTDQRTYNHRTSYTRSHIHALCAELECVRRLVVSSGFRTSSNTKLTDFNETFQNFTVNPHFITFNSSEIFTKNETDERWMNFSRWKWLKSQNKLNSSREISTFLLNI